MNIQYEIVVVGCGGTGSAFLQKFARYQKASETDFEVTLIDGDFVEEKNLKRQSFFSNSVGKNKAEQLATLATVSYGLEWKYCKEYLLESSQLNDIYSNGYRSVKILVGCVDNHIARQVMEEYFEQEKNIFYIDSANDEYDGEVVIGVKSNGIVCSPSRAYYYPDVLTDTSPSVVEESCEVRNQSSPQHQCTNDLAGNIILSIIARIEQKRVPFGEIRFNSLDFSNVHLVWDPVLKEIIIPT